MEQSVGRKREWADGKPRYSGETRMGFDPDTGKRSGGRPRNGENETTVFVSFRGFLKCHITHPLALPYLNGKKVAMLDITPKGTDMILVDGSRVRL